MRVLVTGLDGFTGRYLGALLTGRGHEAIGFDADLGDAGAVQAAVAAARPDGVVHLAAKAFVHSAAFEDFYAVNQLGTFRLLEAVARHCPAAPVVLASSANIYGATASATLGEETAPNPVNHYALSKWAMEQGARFWMDRLAITIVRPFNYSGVGQEPIFLIPKIVDHFRRRAPSIALGTLDAARDYGDVRSVAEVYCAFVEAPPAERVINICTGRGLGVREILAIAERLSGHRAEVTTDPALVRANEIAYLVGDNSRLRALLPDWRPRDVEEMIGWMLDAPGADQAGAAPSAG